MARLLLERGDVNANSKDKDGQAPLSWAAAGGHEAVVKLLLEYKCINGDSKDKYSQTPLLWASEKGHEAVVHLLLEHKDVDPNSKDKDGQAPLSWAARNRHEAVVKLLLERDDVDTDSGDLYDGRTPLSHATERGHKAVVLLEHEGIDEFGAVDKTQQDLPSQENQEVTIHKTSQNIPSGVDLDSVIDRLLEVRGSRLGKQVKLLEKEIRYLCTTAREILISQPTLLELEAPIKVCRPF